VGLSVAGANRNDFKMVRETIESIPVGRPMPSVEEPQGMCMDKGFDCVEARWFVEGYGFTPHIRSRGEEAKARKRHPGSKARRWVVERSHSWMNRFRRILVRWEKRADNYLAMLHIACGIIAWRAAGLLG
jgi:hypothetical protein